ncbi:MAG: GIY-YIG nuclease family protein [Chitinophagales bacterium]
MYIIYSEVKDRYYIGHTQDVEERIATHNKLRNLGANDWVLKYKEDYETRGLAMKRENEIKRKKRRSYLEMLISSVG